ncbi:hypothetical protein DFJ74DRAFT_774919 [Hyaloraphidium curvatum]|nr:hypothetical protein DFJ74DRAFT_774919 [Hyaloraphidium curvatum]
MPSHTKRCGHSCELLFVPRCCGCTDRRPEPADGLYDEFRDGVGFTRTAPRWAGYCGACRGRPFRAHVQAARGTPSPGTSDPAADALAEHLSCPVCMGLLSLPVTLHCGHTFCRVCAVAAVARSPACPVCRAALDRRGVEALRPTFALVGVLEALRSRGVS